MNHMLPFPPVALQSKRGGRWMALILNPQSLLEDAMAAEEGYLTYQECQETFL